MSKIVLVLCVLSTVVASGQNPIYDASTYMTKTKQVKNGVLYHVAAPNSTNYDVIHLYGNATERGFAQGELLAPQLMTLLYQELPDFFKSEAASLPLNGLPAWLQKDIKALLEKDAPAAFDKAMSWVYDQQKDFIGASPANVWEEAAGMAAGMCSVLGSKCPSDLLTTIQHINMLPELLRMQCSMMGAWGPATSSTKLVQLRTLDFGTGPFANRNILVVHHPSDGRAFAAISFPGLLSAVTGFSENIGLSEKVDDVTNGLRPVGTFQGQAVSFVIRDILQFSKTKEDAVRIAQAAKRTWSVWLGFGDYNSQEFFAMLYDEAAAHPFDDRTLPLLTNQTMYKGVAYIDKHPQPSTHADMPALVSKYYGTISPQNVAQNFPRLMQSGDVHAAVYDFADKQVYIALGITNGPTGDFTRLACDAPFLQFDMPSLWSHPHPFFDRDARLHI